MCQALGIPPTAKYQNEGGPSPEQIIALLRREIPSAQAAAVDVARFVDALAFNWIIAGTDAHAKNFSLLHEARGVRIASLYDLVSTAVYPDLSNRMAMKIGSQYEFENVFPRISLSTVPSAWPSCLLPR